MLGMVATNRHPDVEQGFRQRCVLASLLFNIFFTAVLRVAEERFTTDAVIMDSMVQLQRKEKGGKKEGRTRAGRDDGQKGGGGPDIVGTPTMQALYRDHQKGWRR